MHRPGDMHFLSTHESSPLQSLLSLQGRSSQHPDSPHTFASSQLSAVQRAWHPATQRTSPSPHRFAAGASRTSGSRQTSALLQSASR